MMTLTDFSKLSHDEAIHRLEKLQAQLGQYLDLNSRSVLAEIMKPEGIRDSETEYMAAGIVAGLGVATDLLEGRPIGTTRDWAYKTYLRVPQNDVKN